MIKMGSFRSYVGLEEYEMRVPIPSGSTPVLQPKYLSTETLVAEATNVLKFRSLALQNGLSGSLFVTNARLVFIYSDQAGTEESIPLLAIHSICHIGESGGKKVKRRIKIGAHVNESSSSSSSAVSASLFCPGSTRINELLVICSNFRTLRLSFMFSRVDQGQRVVNALIHWTFPKPPEKLFYVEYCKCLDWKSINGNSLPLPLYYTTGDWLREIMSCRASSAFRISMANTNFEICESLPETIVVPANLTDVRMKSLASKLKGNRPPFWVWGNSTGAAILRMAKLHNEQDSLAENAFYETLRGSRPPKHKPHIADLDIDFPVKSIRQSFSKLIELCCPETSAQYEDLDSKFLSHLEKTSWLTWVSKVLQCCGDLSLKILHESAVIILQETESRDTSCLISSVLQVILEERFRTVTGFCSLIQKEWISTGHAFHSGYLHTSPIFLLFLDSVHQLLQQNILEFEFNEQFLMDIWDSLFDSTTGTFLFDSPRQRKYLDERKDLTAWYRIVSKDVDHDDSEIHRVPSMSRSSLNPLYKLKSHLLPDPVPLKSGSKTRTTLQNCCSAMAQIQLWNSLYLNRSQEPITIITNGHGPHQLSINSPVPFLKNISSSPLLKTPKSAPSSASSVLPLPRSLNQGSVFLFSSNANIADTEQTPTSRAGVGRDPNTEFKLVDLLLAAHSRSSRNHPTRQGQGAIRWPSPAANAGTRVIAGGARHNSPSVPINLSRRQPHYSTNL